MAIRFSKYVKITSSVGAGVTVAQRELIARLFTNNTLLPPNSYIEMTALADVGTYFGTTSPEYKRASFYFGFISKNGTAPNKISFARWVDASQAPIIYGNRLTAVLATFTAIANGSFILTLGADTNTISGLDFTAAGSLAAVATIIQTAIRTKTGTMWTAATVTYDSVRGAFIFTGGSAVDALITVQAGGVGTDISTLMGWLPESVNGALGAIWSDGSLLQTLTDCLTRSVDASNNFGSFLFMPTLNQTQLVEVAAWNTATDQNVLFQFMIPVLASNASVLSAALLTYAGCALTLSPFSTEYHEQMPMMIMAATNYDRKNSTQNYMFQQFNATPSVTTSVDSDAYDLLRVNYYGRTQQAGQLLDFYQRGVLTGLAVNPVDMNTYANEQWMKDAIGAAIMELLLALAKVSANDEGRSQVLTIVQSVINQALDNGSISVGKLLSITQKLFITQATNDPNAWYQIQNIGYWIDVVISSSTTVDNRTEFNANYLLLYSKDDAIRKVIGTDILV